MTDDFHLFGDPDDGDRPIDPDLALVSAYLARELSPMQVLALEERLATDAAFRSAMQPLLDAWAAPVPSLEGGASRPEPALSKLERERSWRRFRPEAPAAGSIRQVSPRRNSMKRAAAVIALVVVPMASFAQVVIYAANNPDARGHAIAKRIVAPFARPTFAPDPREPLPGSAQASPTGARAREVDTGALLPVPTAPVFELEAEQTAAKGRSSASGTVAAPLSSMVTVTTSAQRREPNRGRIAELARQHQPAVTNGDSTATYIVMVLDPADRYVWSTFGIGNLAIEVFGDTRTSAERREYNREHYAEFWGSQPPAAVARGYALGVDSSGRPGAIAVEPVTGARTGRGAAGDVARRDSSVAGRDVSGAVRQIVTRRDSVLRVRIDSVERRGGAGGRSGGSGADAGADSARIVLRSGRPVAIGVGIGAAPGGTGRRAIAVPARRTDRGFGLGGGGAEGISPVLAFDASTGTYRSGWYGTPNGVAPNQAEGLTAPGNGQSGIEELPAESVSSAETYYFPAGELAPRPLKIMVVHLTPGTVWTPR